jgi:hypothetical protein
MISFGWILGQLSLLSCYVFSHVCKFTPVLVIPLLESTARGLAKMLAERLVDGSPLHQRLCIALRINQDASITAIRQARDALDH